MKKMHEMSDLAQSVMFTLPAAAAVSLIYGLMYATAYPIKENVQGEIIALDGNTGCAQADENCVNVIDEIHVQVGDQLFEVALRESFLAHSANPTYKIGNRVRTTYTSTRDKEYFGSNDPVRYVQEEQTIILEP